MDWKFLYFSLFLQKNDEYFHLPDHTQVVIEIRHFVDRDFTIDDVRLKTA